jgi:NADPH:quinone reductase-like Zn-dependent oxidoreductase
MKAAVRTRYGPPDVVQISDVEKPPLEQNEVLVKVHATTVNRTDCGIRAAKPWIGSCFPFLDTTQRMVIELKEMMESGAFKPVVDRAYSLDHVVEAYSYVETGQKIGNVVITVNPTHASRQRGEEIDHAT